MPSHPDRVRRNYHDITIRKTEDVSNDTHKIVIDITRQDIASQASLKEIELYVLFKIQKDIREQYKCLTT